jgi:hypothetical protein
MTLRRQTIGSGPAWWETLAPHYSPRRGSVDYPAIPCQSCGRGIGANRSHHLIDVDDGAPVEIWCSGCTLTKLGHLQHLASATRAGAHKYLAQDDAYSPQELPTGTTTHRAARTRASGSHSARTGQRRGHE